MFPAPCRGLVEKGVFSHVREYPLLIPQENGRGVSISREGPRPSFLDYSSRSSDGAALLRPHAVRRQTSVTRASRSKARLLDEPTRRDSWRSHVHCTYTAQRVQSFKLQTANVGGRGGLPSRSLGGPRGIFSHAREYPPYFVAAPPALPPLPRRARDIFPQFF